MMIVFRKSILRPSESVILPSSRICKSRCITSGCAFSISSNSTTEYGRRRNTIIIMTSNVGAETLRRQTTMGFGATKPVGEHEYDTMRDKLLEEAKKAFKPEFINRLDDIIVFHQLTKIDLMQIVDLEVAKVLARLKAQAAHVDLEHSAKE